MNEQRLFHIKLACWSLLLAAGLAAFVGGSAHGGNHDRGLYLSAKEEYERLRKSEIDAANVQRWKSLARSFERIHREMPRSRYADDALFHRGKIYRALYGFDKERSTLDQAVRSWSDLLARYPDSHWAAETRYQLGLIYDVETGDFEQARRQYGELVRNHPGGELSRKAQRRLDELGPSVAKSDTKAPSTIASSGTALLTNVRHTSSKSYTRVTIDLSREVRYETHRLKEDPASGLPPRIYVDLQETRLAMGTSDPIVVQDGLLRQVRVGQFSPDVVRVVLDMTSLTGHNTFLLPDPYRLVIDIQGNKNGGAPAVIERSNHASPSVSSKKIPLPQIRKIVLDPGHGGKDPGAIGIGGIAEKDIVLNIAKKLERKLKRDMGVEVVLTRRDDRFIPLEDRTAIANAEEADLFISLHTNASPNSEARGLETYYLDNTNDEAAMRLAARENGTSQNSVSDLQFILSDLTQNGKLDDSISLAHRLHGSLVSGVGRKYGEVRDLGVKKAQFFVLVGARMPSVLVELFFITNRIEARAVRRDSYQNTVVDALYEGIQKYHQSALAVKTL